MVGKCCSLNYFLNHILGSGWKPYWVDQGSRGVYPSIRFRGERALPLPPTPVRGQIFIKHNNEVKLFISFLSNKNNKNSNELRLILEKQTNKRTNWPLRFLRSNWTNKSFFFRLKFWTKGGVQTQTVKNEQTRILLIKEEKLSKLR
jgi:hypothetical protein